MRCCVFFYLPCCWHRTCALCTGASAPVSDTGQRWETHARGARGSKKSIGTLWKKKRWSPARWRLLAVQQLRFLSGISGWTSLRAPTWALPRRCTGEGVWESLHSCCRSCEGLTQEPENWSIRGLSLTPMGCKWAPEWIKGFSSWSCSSGTFQQKGANFIVLSK